MSLFSFVLTLPGIAGIVLTMGMAIDANITTLIAAVVLFMFGTGPIKGFAVTLSIGIITSMFTAITVTRALVNLAYGGKTNLKSISVGGGPYTAVTSKVPVAT